MDHGHGFHLGSTVVLPAMFAVKEEAELAGRGDHGYYGSFLELGGSSVGITSFLGCIIKSTFALHLMIYEDEIPGSLLSSPHWSPSGLSWWSIRVFRGRGSEVADVEYSLVLRDGRG